MSKPIPVERAPVGKVLLNPRFGVEQTKEDGSIKVRAIDHLSWSPAFPALGADTDGERPSKKAGQGVSHRLSILLACIRRQEKRSV